MSAIVTNTYSDMDMQCPAEWENGFKEARVMQFGDSERALSNPRTGDWVGATFNLSLSDYDRTIRERMASVTDKYWGEALTVKMTTRENRAVLGDPYTVFVGPIVDAQPAQMLAFDLTLGDIVSQGLLSDQGVIPWRKIGDGFIDTEMRSPVSTVDPHLDRDTPEPIIYGSHRRIPDVDPASPQGFCILPPYLGTIFFGPTAWHVWLIAGHACKDIPFWNVIDPLGNYTSITTEGGDWMVPHHTVHDTAFGGAFIDFNSSGYPGTTRRYTLLFGLVTDLTADPDLLTDPDACALGHKQLTVAVDGVEETGDGTGALIIKRIQQYKHFLINYVAHFGIDSYQSGPWLTNPTWTVFGTTVPIVEESSFDAADAIADLRLPSTGTGSPGSPVSDAGYIGAALIGARGGERSSVRRWIAEWNRSCGIRFGITHLGQIRVVMLSPTQAIKNAAPLFRDDLDILRDSFNTSVHWDEHNNRIPFKGDLNHATGVYTTTGMAEWTDSIEKWGREIIGDERDYPFAPGITALYHLARLEVLRNQNPPRSILMEATIGPDLNNESLGYLDLGDYITYRHFASVSSDSAEIRLAQIVRHQVQVGKRRVFIEAEDVDDLIGAGGALSFDRPPQSAGEGGTTTLPPGGTATPIDNFTAFDAITINPYASAYELSLDTTHHPTDDTFGSPSLFAPHIAYAAAWWKMTPVSNVTMSFSTLGSSYDTQLAIFSGDPYGSFVLEAYNDNLAPTAQSVINIDLTGGTTYYILAAGVGVTDAGILRFAAVAPEVGDIYVSTAGSDSSVEPTIDTPYRTLNHALAVIASLGEGTIIMRGGIYAERLINPSVAGSSWPNKIRIAAFPGERVTLRPTGGGITDHLVTFTNGQHYLEFDGIHVDASVSNNEASAMHIEDYAGGAHHIRWMNAEWIGKINGVGHHGNTDAPILIACHQTGAGANGGFEFINLVCHHAGAVGDNAYAFYISTNDFLIDGCEIYDTSAFGIQVYNGGGFVCTGGIIRRCKIHDIIRSYNNVNQNAGIILYGSNIQDVTVENNIIWNIGRTGFVDSTGIVVGSGSHGHDIQHNTIFNIHVNGVDLGTIGTGETGTFRNNIVYQFGGVAINGGSGFTQATNLTASDPQFVDAGAADFRLQATSPAIDTGTTIGAVTTDIDGIPRPQGAFYDIGAHERVA